MTVEVMVKRAREERTTPLMKGESVEERKELEVRVWKVIPAPAMTPANRYLLNIRRRVTMVGYPDLEILCYPIYKPKLHKLHYLVTYT